MNEDFGLESLRRREAERKLQALPPELLDSAWVRECQIEAVIDAVLSVAYASYPAELVHARHVGEWSARIAGALAYGPDPAFARRAGALCEFDPDALAVIPELSRFADCAREFQSMLLLENPEPTTMALITAVADEFDRRVSAFEEGKGRAPSSALATMLAHADRMSRPIVEALAVAMHHHAGPAMTSHRS